MIILTDMISYNFTCNFRAKVDETDKGTTEEPTMRRIATRMSKMKKRFRSLYRGGTPEEGADSADLTDS